MWSNVISIDKGFNKEIDYMLKRLSNNKEVSYATEESERRVWIYLACPCEKQDSVEDWMCSMLENVFLSYLKLRFYKEELNVNCVDYAKCALLSSILHFDRNFERNIIDKMLSSTLDYNVDGLYNFRMKALKESWSEVAAVTQRLLCGVESDDDIFDIASFIAGSDGKKNRLEYSGGVLKNLSERKIIDIVDIYGNSELNLLDSVIREKASEIAIDTSLLSQKMLATLRKIARVIETR